jgi:glucose-6-phosphate isomerase
MFNKKFFFQNTNIAAKDLKKNIATTKQVFDLLKLDIKNFELPLLTSFEKSYEFDFSINIIKKFSKYKNIIIIGMGGSILGTKSIYSFFKKKN